MLEEGDGGEDDADEFYEIIKMISKGNYGAARTEDDIINDENIDINEDLGILANIDSMQGVLEDLKK